MSRRSQPWPWRVRNGQCLILHPVSAHKKWEMSKPLRCKRQAQVITQRDKTGETRLYFCSMLFLRVPKCQNLPSLGVRVKSWSRNCPNCITMWVYRVSGLFSSGWFFFDMALGLGSLLSSRPPRGSCLPSCNRDCNDPFNIHNWSLHFETRVLSVLFSLKISRPRQGAPAGSLFDDARSVSDPGGSHLSRAGGQSWAGNNKKSLCTILTSGCGQRGERCALARTCLSSVNFVANKGRTNRGTSLEDLFGRKHCSRAIREAVQS